MTLRTLVHLRHGERQPGGVHLTERGAHLAQEVGRRLPRFDRVLSSPKPRAVETAEAMGYPVDGELFALGALPEDVGRQVDRISPRLFADYLALVKEVAEARDHAEVIAGLLRDELTKLPDGGRLLVISHGGVIELGAVGALGPAVTRWGPVPGYLEGVQLEHGSGAWERGAVVRPGASRPTDSHRPSYRGPGPSPGPPASRARSCASTEDGGPAASSGRRSPFSR